MSTGAPELIQETEGGIAPGVAMPSDIAARSPLQLFWRRIKQRQGHDGLGDVHRRSSCSSRSSPSRSSTCVGARPPNEQSTEFLDSFGSASGPDFANHTYFGTDGVGRDVFSRTLYGARISLAVAFISTFLTVLIGVVARRHRRLPPRLDRHGALALHGHHARVPGAAARARARRGVLGREGLRDQGRPDRARSSSGSRSSGRSRSRPRCSPRAGAATGSRRPRSSRGWSGPAIGFVLFLILFGAVRRQDRPAHLAGPAGRDLRDRDRELAVHRPHHPRADAVAAREGVRRGGARARRLRPAHHVPAHPAEPGRADHRLHDAADSHHDPVRGGALVPRRRRAAADRQLGRDDQRRDRRSSTPRGGT